MKYLAESDPSFFKEFKLRILGSVFLYQIFRLIEFSVPVPLPKANRMKKMNIDFIIRPNNSKAVLYTMELRTNNQYENGNIIVYFPQILRVK